VLEDTAAKKRRKIKRKRSKDGIIKQRGFSRRAAHSSFLI